MKPVIEDRISEHYKFSSNESRKTVGILATTPERRMVLVKMPEELFCAEPSPDAADNVSQAISAALEASVSGKLDSAKIGVANSVATSVRQLFMRSQGIQLFRDGNFMLCNAYLNGIIKDKEDYINQQNKLLAAAEALIKEEIKELAKMKFDSFSAAVGVSTQVGSVNGGAGNNQPKAEPKAEPD